MAIQKADCSNFVISFTAGLTDDRCLRWLYEICLKGFVLKSYKAKLGSKIKNNNHKCFDLAIILLIFAVIFMCSSCIVQDIEDNQSQK